MKNSFIKMVLAVVVGLILTTFVILFLITGTFSSMASAGSGTPVLPKSGVMVIDMSQITLSEQASTQPDIMAMVQGQTLTPVGLFNAVNALKTAAVDPSVKYILLKTDGLSAGLAQLQEFRKALSDFRTGGKPVIAYVESPSTGSYYLASVADKVYMTSYQGASTMITGVGSRLIFLKDILDKLGVNVQLIRHGKYKSAGEMYIKNAPSPENLEQNQAMIDAVWASYASEIAQSRDITVEALNAAIDELKLNFPEDFLREGLVDGLLTREELHSKLADLAVVDSYKKLKTFTLPDYIAAKSAVQSKAKDKIAIVYADGEIVDGDANQDVAGDRLASVIAKVRADSTVKAVVFRVNSPGGSVLASEKIKAEVDLLKAEKPVVASFGDYAASGGYWISNNCDKIYADATTLTGSIGVFSMIPEFSDVMKNLAHVNVVTIGSNKHSDMYSLMRPFDQDELDYMQASVENIYDRFVNIVAEGRGLEPDFVDSIAQGRVWAGSDALEIGLVDEIGTLQDAVLWAVNTLGADVTEADYRIEEYPKPLTTMEQVMEMLGQTKNPEEEIFAGTAFEPVAKSLISWKQRVKKNPADVMFARIPYAMEVK